MGRSGRKIVLWIFFRLRIAFTKRFQCGSANGSGEERTSSAGYRISGLSLLKLSLR
jgi:hypothetical protein